MLWIIRKEKKGTDVGVGQLSKFKFCKIKLNCH